ncbi:glycosyl hydrolase [Aureococcus anophagefferens]|nr:glycosyl hydrolase [Aureococcus anophagefferens]
MARAAARAACLLLLCAAAAVAEEADAFSPVEYANLLAGSFTKGDVFSTGNTMPLPSPWIGDYGWFFVGPQMGGFTTKPTGFFEPRSGRIKPHAMDFRTAPDGMRVELAPTMHGAALRVTFPGASRAEKRVCFKLGGGGGDSYKSAGGGAAEFGRTELGGAPNFNHHVFVEAVSGSPSFESHGHDTFCFGYPSSATTVEEQARHTYDVELRRESSHERSFGDVRLESEDEWNALFRTVYPLLALVYPDHLGWIVDGWVNAYREGGWIPKWASPGYRNSMVGTYGDVVVAEAIGGAVGKVGLRVYNQHGYIPADSGVSDCVSRTLDFAHADWATANAAEVLGHAEDAKRLRDRARGAVTHLYDKSTGLMRPKQKSGAFSSRFSPTRWGDGYTEGSAWHHSFPPFDVELLASLHGGKDGLTIHEMREMRALAMGQYGHNNQPSHHILWLLHLCGRADLGNKHVRRVIDDAYMADAYSGDEDNGEMGSWFVLAALGLFSVSPGSEDYVLGGPLFDRVTISGIPGRPALDIYAHRPDRSVTDVAEIWLATAGDHGEVKVDAPSIRYSALKKGGQLHFYMKGTSKASAALHWTTANNAGRDAAPAHGAVETLVEDAVSKLAATRDEFWQSVPREAEAPPRPLEPPAFPVAERPPIAAAVAPAAPPRRPAAPAKLTRDDPPPPPPLPLGFLAGVAFAAFCAGRCSKRRDGGRGKRQAHIV